MSGPKYSQTQLNELNSQLVSIYVDIQTISSQIVACLKSEHTKRLLSLTPFSTNAGLLKAFEEAKREFETFAQNYASPQVDRRTYGEAQISAKLAEARALRIKTEKLYSHCVALHGNIVERIDLLNRNLSMSIISLNQETRSHGMRPGQKLSELPGDYRDYADTTSQDEMHRLHDQLIHALDSIPSAVPVSIQGENSELKSQYDKALERQREILKSVDDFDEFVDRVHKEALSARMMTLSEMRAIDSKEDTIEDVLSNMRNGGSSEQEAGLHEKITMLRGSIQTVVSEILNYSQGLYSERATRIMVDSDRETNPDKLSLLLQQLKFDRVELATKQREAQDNRQKLREVRMSLQSVDRKDRRAVDLLDKLNSLEKEPFPETAEVISLSREAASFADAIKQDLVRKEKNHLIRQCVYETLKALRYEPESDFETTLINNSPMAFSTNLGPDYKLMTSFSPRGEMLTRLIRTVATDRDRDMITERQRVKDLEAMRSWCQDYDFLMASLQETGIDARTVWRKPAEADHLHIEVVEKAGGLTAARQSSAKIRTLQKEQ